MSSHLLGPHRGDGNESQRADALRAAGWNWTMAKSLAAYDHDVESARLLTPREALEVYLTYEGIVGYAETIMDAVDNCRNQEAL